MGPRFAHALAFASTEHALQTRKGTTVPYIAHLLTVCALVIEAGGDETAAIAALLHDAVEDQGGAPMMARIRDEFGDDVAGIVGECSDTDVTPKPPWRERKEDYVAAIATKSDQALLVSLADKVHNASSILSDHQQVGDEVWQRFTGGRDGTLWYYRALADAFRGRMSHMATPRRALQQRLDAVVSTLESRCGLTGVTGVAIAAQADGAP